VNITPIPCLADNYAYLLDNPDAREAIVIDPSEADPILRSLRARRARLVAVLCTHHHYDHVGGLAELVRAFPGVRVFAHSHDLERIPRQTDSVEDGASLEMAGIEVRVLHVPGHTLGGVAYLTDDAVFTGDTLFLAGCGRLFEGTAPMMYDSLERILALGEHFRVFCGHEYTESNLLFASALEPESAAIKARMARVRLLRSAGRATVGAALLEEAATNPFLRTSSPELRATLNLPGDMPNAEVFSRIRAQKDTFRPRAT
jgi:hydroxyacylglutathione hydrolase